MRCKAVIWAICVVATDFGMVGPAQASSALCLCQVPEVPWQYAPKGIDAGDPVPAYALASSTCYGYPWEDAWGYGPYAIALGPMPSNGAGAVWPQVVRNPYCPEDLAPVSVWYWPRPAPLRIRNPHVEPGDPPSGGRDSPMPRRPQVVYPTALAAR